MIAVDRIGEIRRAYFGERLPIKEIVRRLSVSRSTVRKVVRSSATEFRYEREKQPAPKLGEWVKVLTEILEREADLPRRERRSTQRLFEARGGVAMRARMTACIALPRRGGVSRPGFRCGPMCR